MGKTDSSSVLLALVLLIYCFYLQFGTALDTITPSKSIKDPEVIISKTGVFRLGFFSFANSTNRYVGICYNHIPVQTVIWVANRNKPLKDSSGILKISEDDSGNLVLTDNNNGLSIWESFEHPSNAFLPTMKMGTDVRRGEKVQLRSRKSNLDPSDGNFSTGLEPLKIPEIIIWKNNQIYFRTGPWNGLIFIGLIYIYSVYHDGLHLVTDFQKETYYFTYAFSSHVVFYYEIDSQGKIAERKWDAGNGNWQQNFRMQQTDCDVYGKCGAFGSCDSKKPSICSCLRGFEPKNREEWNRENWTSGCVRTTPLQCQRSNNGSEVGQEDGFLKLEMMKVPAFPDWSSKRDDGNCEDQCLKDCSCIAYAYDVGIGCMFWSGNLIDIQKFSSDGVDLYIRLASFELDRKKDQSKVVLITTVIVGIIFITTSTFLLWNWMAKHRGRKHRSKLMKLIFNKGKAVAEFSIDNEFEEKLIEVKLQQLSQFNFEELTTATNNFHFTKKLGQGGFGPVYRGTLEDGKEIAVKRLSKASSQGLEEFMNEVVVISKLQHRNLVRLLGCCAEGEEKMLVYEYLPNKSLDAFIFGYNNANSLFYHFP
ncbi:hypothetical protein REPUB_Repub11eG0005000 [Reevesia pubescens]